MKPIIHIIVAVVILVVDVTTAHAADEKRSEVLIIVGPSNHRTVFGESAETDWRRLSTPQRAIEMDVRRRPRPPATGLPIQLATLRFAREVANR